MAEEVIKIVGTADMSSLNKGIETSKSKLDSLNKTVQTTSKDLKNGVAGTNQAAFALTNLGRVAQDAPFGFIGIQNNLNPLLESFQRLKVETGSTGAALKALGSSLIGPAGLGFALSIVSSLILVFSSNTKKAKEDVDEKKEATNKAAEIEKKFGQEVSAASNALLGQAKNLLNLKNILTSTSGEYLKLTEATKKQALAQFLFGQRSDEVKNILDATIKQQLLQAKINNPFAGKEYVQGLDAVAVYLNKVKNGTAFYSKAALDAAKNTEALAKATQSLSGLNELSKGFDKLFSNIVNGQITLKPSKIKIDGTSAEVSLGEETLKKQIKFGPEQKVSLAVEVEIAPKINKKGGIAQAIQDAIAADILAAQQAIAVNTARLQEFATNSFASLGDAIGNSLAAAFSGESIGNIFGNLFGSILESLGRGIRQLGIEAIAASKLILAIRASLGTPQGIIAGIGLVALGTVITGIAAKLKAPKFATGTRNFSGGTAIVGERGPELIGLPRGASVTPNAQSNAILNGAGGGGFVASYVLRGQDLITVINRTNQSNNRAGFN